MLEHLFSAWGGGSREMKKQCYLHREHRYLFLDLPLASNWPSGGRGWGGTQNCSGWVFSSLKWAGCLHEVPPSSHNACVWKTKSDLTRSSKSRKGARIRYGSQASSLRRLMGNPQEFLTSPHIRPSSNAGNLVYYLQQTQWNHFLNETPLQSQMLSRGFPFNPSFNYPIPPRFLPRFNLV